MAEPLYRMIAEDLRGKIESGELGRGEQMPTEAELKESYGASRNTVRDAIKWLTQLGLVETRPGQGTFVTMRIEPYVNVIGSGTDDEPAPFLADVTSYGRQPTLSSARIEVQPASDAVASELQIAAGSEVVLRQHQRYIDGTPWSLQTSFYPMDLVRRGAVDLLRSDRLQEGPAAYLAHAIGIAQASWSDRLAVRTPSDAETRFFALPAEGPIPVVDISQTGYDPAGVPIRFTTTTYPADRNHFQRTLGTVPAGWH